MITEGRSLIGRALGDFIVRDVIGEGGFGAVYRAEQPMLGREAVIKVSSSAGTPEFVQRFLREARLASKLDHPYAAHIYAFGSETDGVLWTAMELVRGTPLDQLIKQNGPLRLERFLPLFDKLCEVVHTAHEQGIIHRDLKPANVMVLSRAGRLLPKLLDLGIAKGGDAPVTDESEKQVGSPAYMAPEQWVDARKTDARTDVYALGVLAYEVLTGRLPFAGGSVMQIARAHAKQLVPALGGELPVALDAVIAKAMAKKAADRFVTALELATAMREAAAVEPELKLPELDPFLREEMLASSPQPLAEAVAALDGVRNVHQAQGAIFGIVRVVARTLGNLALATWRDSGEGDIGPAVRELRRQGMSDAAWLELARTIATQLASKRDTLAVPELVDALAPPVVDDLGALVASKVWFDSHLAATESAMLAQLAEEMPRLDRLLRALSWTSAYAMVVPRGAFAERWMGVRRPHRAVTPLRGAEGNEGELVLLDADGTKALALSPFFHVGSPAPGHAHEVFVLDGVNRDGARMVSLPTGFERTDEPLWTWLVEKAGIDLDEREQQADQKPPYRGLATFTREDADQFVGREQETEAFANRLRITPLLVVVGASGAGKSSFVQAGVVPALGAGWTTLIARPGASPVGTLVATVKQSELARSGIGSTPVRDEELAGEGLGKVLRAWTEREKRSVLVYIDQFEELFTLCHDAAERERYVQMLVRAARSADDAIRVVLTVRDDFLLRCQQVEALRERLVHGLQLLATPTQADLERILVEPARRTGYQFEDPELPQEMVGAVAEMAAALPLLSFTAAQMWDLRDRHHHRLTRKAYETLGGVGGALAQHAERIYGQMTHDEQRLVRVAFRNLVTADGTRAVLTRAELFEVLGEPRTAEAVIEKLITARLLSASEGVGGVDRVEVVHEALLSAWPRLIEWRREDAEGARLRDQLRAAARQWEERGRPRGLLWRDEALTEYQLWRVRHGGQLMAVELEFGDASAREALRGRRLRNIAVGTILGILVVGMVVALVLYRDAESQRSRAASNEKRAVTNETRANELVISGYLNQGQRAAVAGDANQALVYLEAAKRGGANGPVLELPLAQVRRSMNAERAAYRGHEGRVLAIATLPDGKLFATGGADRTLVLWSIDSPTPIARFTEATQSVHAVAASPDGTWIATASGDGHVRVYDVARRALANDWTLSETATYFVQFTPQGKVVSFADDQQVGVWDPATGALVRQFKAEGDTAGLGAVSPDGTRIAIPSYDRFTRVWDLRTGALVHRLGPHDDTAWVASFSPDGAIVATASWDKSVKLWDLRTGTLRGTLVGHSGSLEVLAWRPDGALIASGGRDGAARVWDRAGHLKATLACGRGAVRDIRWTADPDRALVLCGDTSILFDIRVGLPLFRKQATGADVLAARVLMTGDVLTAEADGTARRWTPILATRIAIDAHIKDILRFDPCDGGKTMLSVGIDHAAKLWSRDGRTIWRSDPKVELADATCARDGDALFTARTDGTLWRVTGDAATQLPAGPALAADVVIKLSPDGTKIAIVDADHRARLLVIADGTLREATPASFKRSWEPKVHWADDSSAFAVASDAGAVVWDGTTGALRFEIAAPGGLLRRLTIDVPSESIFVTGFAPGVWRYALRDGRQLAHYASDGFAWNTIVIGGMLYAGFDDASVVEYDIAGGKMIRSLGSFGGDIHSLADGGGTLLWVGAGNRTLSLVDRQTRAVLFRTDIPTEAVFLVPHGSNGAAVAGLSSSLAFTEVANDPVELARLELEVRCRTAFALENGGLVPRKPDVDACEGLR
ncbi:MAG: protein kinase domain-containing protein [Kofleriaceae bacterium]